MTNKGESKMRLNLKKFRELLLAQYPTASCSRRYPDGRIEICFDEEQDTYLYSHYTFGALAKKLQLVDEEKN
jgi:hypothetical protein